MSPQRITSTTSHTHGKACPYQSQVMTSGGEQPLCEGIRVGGPDLWNGNCLHETSHEVSPEFVNCQREHKCEWHFVFLFNLA